MTRRVLADQHHGEAGRQIVIGLQAFDLLGHPATQTGGEGLAVDDLRFAHESPLQLCLSVQHKVQKGGPARLSASVLFGPRADPLLKRYPGP